MGKLVVVYGMDSELEEALGRLQAAGLGEEVRVVQGLPEDAAEAGDVPDPAPDVVVPPSATLGTSVPLGTPAAFSPYAAEGVAAEGARAGAGGWSRRELEDLTGARDDEAGHLLDVVSGGGSLLVVEGDDGVLDAAERALAGRTGQGAVRR